MLKLVTYQFNPPNPINLGGLINELQRSSGWAHQIDNVWLIDTNETVEQLNARLQTFFSANDRLLVASLPAGSQFQGWMPGKVWDWIASVQQRNTQMPPPPSPPDSRLLPGTIRMPNSSGFVRPQ